MSSQRKNVMLGTAGHVDHGKTSLVKLLTGCDTDTLAEEKQRGLTMDIGFAPCRLADDRVVGVVDVPGHVDFIRNMVAGAHGIDVVIFVVAADDGIMPQTHEHLHILTLMGLRHGLVALTKVDIVDAARRSFVLGELRRLLAGTFLAEAPICPISNTTGEGFDGFFDTLNQVVQQCEDRSSAGVFRLWVEDVFTIRGSGTVITGIPVSGRVRAGDSAVLWPAGLPGRVRRMQVYGEESAEGRAGECLALNMPELDHLAVRRGMVLSAAENVTPVTMAEGELRILDSVPGKIEDYLEVQLHVGTAAVQARIAMLETTEMVAGQRQMIQLRTDEPLPLAVGDRFVVRANLNGPGQSGLTTIGGGRILGTSNLRLRRKKQWTLDALAARRDALNDPLRWCELMVRESTAPLMPGDLPARCGLRTEEVTPLIQQLCTQGRLFRTASGSLAHHDAVQQTGAKILAAIQTFHAANSQRDGLGREELILQTAAPPEVCDLALNQLLGAKQVERNGTVFARAGWSARLSDRDQRLCDQITAAYQKAGWTSPAPAELVVSLKETPDRVDKMIRLLGERGVLIKLEDRLYMHRDAIEAAKQVVLRLFARARSFTTMQFRDELAVSRKYAVPLVDYLDRIRYTVRNGHDRTPGVEARKRLEPNA